MCVCTHNIDICFCEVCELESSHTSGMYTPHPKFHLNVKTNDAIHTPEKMKMIIFHIISYIGKIELGQKKKKERERENSNCEVMGNSMIVIINTTRTSCSTA